MRWRLAVGLVSFILTNQLRGDVKNPWHCFQSVDVDPVSWSIWLVPSIVWLGEVRSHMDWSGWIVRLNLLTSRISPICFPRNSALGCNWHHVHRFSFPFTAQYELVSAQPNYDTCNYKNKSKLAIKTSDNTVAHDNGLEEVWESHFRPLTAHAFDSLRGLWGILRARSQNMARRTTATKFYLQDTW